MSDAGTTATATDAEPGEGAGSRGEPRGTHRSQLQTFLADFRRNRLSVVGGVIIVLAVLTAVLAPAVAPHDPLAQFDAPDGQFNPMPPNSEVIVTNDNGEAVGRTTAYLGTDGVGRDILSRSLYGLRTLLTVSISVVLLALLLGVSAGAVAGYYGDTLVDEVIMRFMDMLFSFPSIILAVAVLGVLGGGQVTLGPVTLPSVAKVVVVVAIAYTPRFARVMRGATLREMEEDYVAAAKSMGARDYRILAEDVLINTVPVVIVQGTMYMGTVVLTVAALSFLGVGIQPPTPSLGLMLSSSRSYIYSGEWWFSVFPGLGIMVVILGFNLLGDGLRDTLDPRYTEETIE
jgi:ABC-type dipeptide/oligopeptide/nickel transport system permease subunit